jgi:hypothetical protein
VFGVVMLQYQELESPTFHPCDLFQVRALTSPPRARPLHGFIPSIHVSLQFKVLISHVPLWFDLIFDGRKSCNTRMKRNLLAPS